MTVFHLVDHKPPGSLLYLIKPLSDFAGHAVYTSFDGPDKLDENAIKRIKSDFNSRVVLHCTGRQHPFFKEAESFLGMGKLSFVFMHVAPHYLRIRGREDTIATLHSLHKKLNTSVIATGQELANLYREEGLPTHAVQVGIKPQAESITPAASEKRDIILTTCTDEAPDYQYIKGIDLFTKLVSKQKLEKQAFIAGYSGAGTDGITRRQLPHPELQALLKRTRVYVQLSRTEAYNLTAVEAKRQGIPVIVSDTEGHRDNVRFGFRARDPEEAAGYLDIIMNNPGDARVSNSVADNYEDSLKRETSKNFASSLNKALK